MPHIRPYAAQHTDPQGPGDSRPTATQVIRDQHLLNGLPGIKILITGATSGIGVETARALHLTGADIYITARDPAKGEAVAKSLSTDPERPVRVIEMSLNSFDSIRQGAAAYLAQSATLNCLINNAGIMACPEGKTADGHDLQFGTNHLGHFLLFSLLKNALLAGAAETSRPSRVISVSSTGHRMVSRLDFDNLNFSRSEYSPWVAYGNSKLANVYFANELDRRFKDQHLRAFSLHPGSVETPLQRFVKGDERYGQALQDTGYQMQRKSAEQGAATSVWAAVAGELEGRGGMYLEDVGEAGPWVESSASYGPGYSEMAFDREAEHRLWEVSERMCDSEGNDKASDKAKQELCEMLDNLGDSLEEEQVTLSAEAESRDVVAEIEADVEEGMAAYEAVDKQKREEAAAEDDDPEELIPAGAREFDTTAVEFEKLDARSDYGARPTSKSNDEVEDKAEYEGRVQ